MFWEQLAHTVARLHVAHLGVGAAPAAHAAQACDRGASVLAHPASPGAADRQAQGRSRRTPPILFGLASQVAPLRVASPTLLPNMQLIENLKADGEVQQARMESLIQVRLAANY